MFVIIFLCIGGFIAAFVDSIAGGGGLISMPVLMAIGVPIHLAIGTNKFAASAGCISSAYRYAKSGKTNNELLKKLVPFTIIGSILGVKCVLSINENILNVLVVLMILIVAIYTFVSKNLGQEDRFEGINKKNLRLGMLMAFIMGFYDGFFGPGTGTFLAFGFIKIYGYDFLHASANTKILNLTSNVTSLLLFMINGQVYYKIAVLFALVMIIGAYVGAKVAIKNGSKMIKPIFLVMALFMVTKLMYQTLF
ncbi:MULTISPECIES: sulfite exporter TauE/SafE family protein [unclassified Clostridioides]|uniref:sulfite exporter TauE/SafE family protein n=1 Tax=unclassified Clostridioides TaxID=2635829 RepID=UPI001D10DDEB|nr:TSUP family transporter [Clostridioides sp. ZZV15-6388]MCC0643317.1 TSUP family transporter [Clostridioides sp. ZZV14-6150]MCC0658854.1 TSUP family transporter [Clostridioides sp. ZZV14-6154]MCC0666132.1 TSUP family transporter [Clostridioides sp. ZZV15-6597]MCC0667703.1 TSUP family transporter [Clostridioides sp. ZZV14-6153]MCC0718599.1 TSUP family transporter [Clostridioides sp. ZZV14-6105]MCC0721850.1 TSUP family transporter [Clostridioides sp. ZZV14-6104]MCC0728675.1 TSUP family trans